MIRIRSLVLAVLALLTIALPASASLYGISWGTGKLYTVDGTTAALTEVGNTGIVQPGGLEFGPDGTLYAIGTGSSASLYKVDPLTAASSVIGSLNQAFVFEGGIAFAPNGTCYAVNSGSAGDAHLMTVDLASGNVLSTVTMSFSAAAAQNVDINGLAWRSDGQLVGIEDFSNNLVTIDPTTGHIAVLNGFTPGVGGFGGMAVDGGVGYLTTSGSQSLYTFDLFTGSYSFVGSYANAGLGSGISGLAARSAVPEPGGLLLGALGLAAVVFLRRRA